MKSLKNCKAWLIKAATELNLTELRVFIVWFEDAPEFSAGAGLLHKRLPHIARQNIQKAIRSLVKKGFLVAAGKRGSRIHYNLGILSASDEIPAADVDESVDIQNESIQIPNESPETQKSISTDSRTKKTKKNKEEEEARSSQIISEEAKEEKVSPLGYDHSNDPDYNTEKPWLKTMAKLKSEYQIWFDSYVISGDGYKNFGDDAIDFISSSNLTKFTEEELSYEEWPEHSFILSLVEAKLGQRFKKNDRVPHWSFDGSICQGILSRIRDWLDRKAVTRIPKKIDPPWYHPIQDTVDVNFMKILEELKES